MSSPTSGSSFSEVWLIVNCSVLIGCGAGVVKEAIKIASRLREFFPTYMDVMRRSLSAQLSYANSINASFAVLVGKNEIKEAKVTLRNLETGEQEKLSVEECVERLKVGFDVK